MDLDQVKSQSVAFGYIHNLITTEPFAFSMLRLHLYDVNRRRLLEGVARGSGPFYAQNREAVMRVFYENKPSEWLLTADTNNEFEPDCLYKLLAVADPDTAPIVSALYASRPGVTGEGIDPELRWMWYDVNENDEYINVSMIKGSAPIQCIQNAGMGMVLIHRSVLDRFPEAEPGRGRWFGHDIYHVEGKTVELGEDMTFFHRARLAGIPLHGCPHVRLVHWKLRREKVSDLIPQS